MPKLPQVNGRRLVKTLCRLGYSVERVKGSHVRLKKRLASGSHYVTVPLHRVIDKGTLHGILSEVSRSNNIDTDTILNPTALNFI